MGDEEPHDRFLRKQDLEKIAEVLHTLLKNTKALCVLLVDSDGRLVIKKGETSTYDMDTISALVAGSCADTKHMARLLGEREFSLSLLQGKKENIQLSLVGERMILVVVFENKDKKSGEMVRLYANQVSSQLSDMFGRQKRG